jgi:hypothetical protein
MASAVRSSVGKNDSIESSATVASSAFPKLVLVLMKENASIAQSQRHGDLREGGVESRSGVAAGIAGELVVQRA